ncbi:acyl-CoA dehydrogenase family protein [Bacillus marasmi]|uniref:acyl-CoA dehydrogenase family protein n=1 Tax=Bacillus marasmi TaxID=1926279 RepID=UPI00164D55C7
MFQQLQSRQERIELMNKLKESFRLRAAKIDEEGLFPFENIKELKDTGYTALTVPKAFGGMEISLLEMVMLQEIIAEGDGATALGIGWHIGIIKNLSEKNNWQPTTFGKLCEQVMAGALINSAATEKQTGSPTRGGKPATIAHEQNGKWVVNGRKTFTTMAPVLDYFLVSASLEDGTTGNFLIPRNSKGLEIEETWDSIAMKGTASHDLVLKDVDIDDDALVERMIPGKKQAGGWLLHIPACYLGIAQAARNEAINFAKHYSPSSISGTISELPNVQQKLGELELLLIQSRHFLYSVARKWDESFPEDRLNMQVELSAVKHSVTNNAIKVVDLAMRIVGAQSLSLKSPLQRYYRDVRAGLHNPPMDDMTIGLLARVALEDYDRINKKSD